MNARLPDSGSARVRRRSSTARLARGGATAVAVVVTILIVVVVGASRARADRTDEAWKQANDDFLKGDYTSAIAAYEQLERQPVISPDLAFNLGNAYFRNGQLGPAIWAWERALSLDPDDEDARYNVDQARRAVARRVEDKIQGLDREPGWIRVVTQLSPATETWLFVGLYLSFFVAIGLFVRARRHGQADADADVDADAVDTQPVVHATWGVVSGLLGAGALCAGALLTGRFILDRTPFAIVLPDAASVKEGADVNYRTTFAVHAGLRVRVLEQDHDWVRVRLANGLDGWLPGRSVGPL